MTSPGLTTPFHIASIFIVLLSTGVYARLVIWADRYEPEPRRLLFLALVWGAVVSTFFASLTEGRVDHLLSSLFPQQIYKILSSSIVAPLIEEGIKGAFLLILYKKWRYEMDGIVDGLVYGSIVGFGFAAVENLSYFSLSPNVAYWIAIVFFRQFMFGLNHAFFTSFTGLGLGLARWYKGRLRPLFPILGFGIAVGTHSLHNTLVGSIYGILGLIISWLAETGGILIILLVWLLSIRKERRIIAEHLRSEVPSVVSEEIYERLTNEPIISVQRRRNAKERKLHRLAAELAIKKYQKSLASSEKEKRELHRRITQLRADLVALRNQTEEDKVSS